MESGEGLEGERHCSDGEGRPACVGDTRVVAVAVRETRNESTHIVAVVIRQANGNKWVFSNIGFCDTS